MTLKMFVVSPLTRRELAAHGPAERPSAPNNPSTGLRDLAYATAMVEASERMLDQPDLAALWPLIAAEAAALITADQVAILSCRGVGWQVLAAHDSQRATADRDLEVAINAAAAWGWLREPGCIDLTADARWSATNLPGSCAGWRSLLVVNVAPVAHTDLTRLVWCSDRSGNFVPFMDVGHLFGRHVSAAVRSVTRRENLNRAIAARHRIGQAQGILMARHGLTAEEAFQALKRQSQRTNIKLHTIADKIIGGRPTFIG